MTIGSINAMTNFDYSSRGIFGTYVEPVSWRTDSLGLISRAGASTRRYVKMVSSVANRVPVFTVPVADRALGQPFSLPHPVQRQSSRDKGSQSD
jgi:hypothetical protein